MEHNSSKKTEPADSVTITLTFKVGGQEQSRSHHITLRHTPDQQGIDIATTQAFAELEKEIRFSDDYEKMPDPGLLGEHSSRQFTPEEWGSQEHSFFLNTQQVWREITNTLYSARYLLAQSRAYKYVEELIINEGADHRTSEVMNVHLDKMNALNGAVYHLAKIEDLYLLLLFVNFGNSLVETDTQSPDWQKKLIWVAVRDGLRKRHPEVVSNRYLNQLSDDDYSTIMSGFKRFKGIGEVKEITDYRDATTHRVPPAVDYHGLTAVLLFPQGKESAPQMEASNLIRRYVVDYQFLDLYKKATKVFSHYVEVLSELKAVPRFS
jgi:hypothetical protein